MYSPGHGQYLANNNLALLCMGYILFALVDSLMPNVLLTKLKVHNRSSVLSEDLKTEGGFSYIDRNREVQ